MTSKPQFVGELVKLGDVCELVLGQSPSSDTYNTEGDGLPFYQGNADFGKVSPTPQIWCSKPKKIAHKGDILISVRAPIGALNLANEECCIGRGITAIRANGALVEVNFLKQQLLARRGLLESQGTGSTFTAVGKNVLADFPICLPSINKQTEISNQLQSILNAIELKNEQTSRLDVLVKSRFIEMFGDPVNSNKWPRYKIGDVYAVKSSKRIYAKEQTRTGIPFYRLADINALIDNGHANSKLYISEDTYAELAGNNQVPLSGDILVTARGTLGRCYIIALGDCFYFQDGMITWLSRKEVSPLPTYLVSVFENAHFIDSLQASCSGTTVRYLSIFDLANTTIPLPPTALQEEFTDFVACTDKLRVVAEEQKKKLQTLYDSLAQDYFAI